MKHGVVLVLSALILGCGVGLVSAQEQKAKTAIGAVSKIEADLLSVDTGKGTLQFVTNKDTQVKVVGGSTKAREAKSAGEKGVKITEAIHTGDQVVVKYSEAGGKMVASSVEVKERRPKIAQPVK